MMSLQEVEIEYLENCSIATTSNLQMITKFEDMMILTSENTNRENFTYVNEDYIIIKSEEQVEELGTSKIPENKSLYASKKSSQQISLRICSFCNKQFNTCSELRGHMHMHNGEPYKCQICDRVFTRQSNLWKHVHLHTGVKRFQCQTCKKKFSQKANLKKHELIHEGKKPYSCNYCTKSFSQQANLMKHVRIHTGEKPYQCTICMKKFTQQSNLHKHEVTHKGIDYMTILYSNKSPNKNSIACH